MADNGIRFYRYEVESLHVLIGSEVIKLTEKDIESFEFEKAFDDDYFPIFKINTSLETDLYYKIVENKDTVKFRFRLLKYISDSSKTINIKKEEFNELFCIFLEDSTPNLDKNKDKDAAKVEGTSKNPRSMGGSQSFYLFKEADVINSKAIINDVVAADNMTTVLGYILSTIGFNKILMSPMDNTDKVNGDIIPALTLTSAIKYLDQQYGFYKEGMLMFFDIDCAYILRNSSRCTAWRSGEYKTTLFTIKDSTNAENLKPGSYMDEQNKTHVINIAPGSIDISSESVVEDQIDGNNLMIINSQHGTISKRASNSEQRGSGTYKVMINRFNNPYIADNLIARKKEKGAVITVQISDFDISALSPNKEFKFSFEDTSVNKIHSGSYRITHAVISFTKQGTEYSIDASCQFKKI